MIGLFRRTAACLLLAGCAAVPQAEPMAAEPMATASTVEAATDIGAAARTAAAIERIAARDAALNAVIAVEPTAIAQASALDARGADGPLAGVPVLLKDNIETRGTLPTTAGSLALRANVTDRDAPLVANLRAADAVILGKTNLSEWANFRSFASTSGWSAVGGQARNPWDPTRSPCGSSSGSAVAVAAGYVDHAVGTETDGSVTCPAAMNGIVGMKPSVGLVSRTHVVPISVTQDTAGPMTRSVRQAATLLAAIAGRDDLDAATQAAPAGSRAVAIDGDVSLAGRRIGVLRSVEGFGADDAFADALALMEARGAVLVDVPEVTLDENAGMAELTVLLAEFADGIDAYLATTDPARVPTRSLEDLIDFNAGDATELSIFDQSIFEAAMETGGTDSEAYRTALAASRDAARAELQRLLSTRDVEAIVFPTVAPAFLITPEEGDQWPGGGAGYLAARAGTPHLTVPMGLSNGLPVGLSFIGPMWSDRMLLELGAAYEDARGAFPRPPNF